MTGPEDWKAAPGQGAPQEKPPLARLVFSGLATLYGVLGLGLPILYLLILPGGRTTLGMLLPSMLCPVVIGLTGLVVFVDSIRRWNGNVPTHDRGVFTNPASGILALLGRLVGGGLVAGIGGSVLAAQFVPGVSEEPPPWWVLLVGIPVGLIGVGMIVSFVRSWLRRPIVHLTAAGIEPRDRTGLIPWSDVRGVGINAQRLGRPGSSTSGLGLTFAHVLTVELNDRAAQSPLVQSLLSERRVQMWDHHTLAFVDQRTAGQGYAHAGDLGGLWKGESFRAAPVPVR